jgi:hypothetical protein
MAVNNTKPTIQGEMNAQPQAASRRDAVHRQRERGTVDPDRAGASGWPIIDRGLKARGDDGM